MRQWYIVKNKKEEGPFSSRELKKMAAEGRISKNTSIRLSDSQEVMRASSIIGLFVVNHSKTGEHANGMRENLSASETELGLNETTNQSGAQVHATENPGQHGNFQQSYQMIHVHAEAKKIRLRQLPNAKMRLARKALRSSSIPSHWTQRANRLATALKQIDENSSPDDKAPGKIASSTRQVSHRKKVQAECLQLADAIIASEELRHSAAIKDELALCHQWMDRLEQLQTKARPILNKQAAEQITSEFNEDFRWTKRAIARNAQLQKVKRLALPMAEAQLGAAILARGWDNEKAKALVDEILEIDKRLVSLSGPTSNHSRSSSSGVKAKIVRTIVDSKNAVEKQLLQRKKSKRLQKIGAIAKNDAELQRQAEQFAATADKPLWLEALLRCKQIESERTSLENEAEKDSGHRISTKTYLLATAAAVVILMSSVFALRTQNTEPTTGLAAESEIGIVNLPGPETTESRERSLGEPKTETSFNRVKTKIAFSELIDLFHKIEDAPSGWAALDRPKMSQFWGSLGDAASKIDCEDVALPVRTLHETAVDFFSQTLQSYDDIEKAGTNRESLAQINQRIQTTAARMKAAFEDAQTFAKREFPEWQNDKSIAKSSLDRTRPKATVRDKFEGGSANSLSNFARFDNLADWRSAITSASYLGHYELYKNMPAVRLVVDLNTTMAANADKARLYRVIKSELTKAGLKLDPRSDIRLKITMWAESGTWRSVEIDTRYNLERTRNRAKIFNIFLRFDLVVDLPVWRGEQFVKIPVSLISLFDDMWATSDLRRDQSPSAIIPGFLKSCHKYLTNLEPLSAKVVRDQNTDYRKKIKNAPYTQAAMVSFYNATRPETVTERRPLDDVAVVQAPVLSMSEDAQKITSEARWRPLMQAMLSRSGIKISDDARHRLFHELRVENGYFTKAGELFGAFGSQHRFYAFNHLFLLEEPVILSIGGQFCWAFGQTKQVVSQSTVLEDEINEKVTPTIKAALSQFPHSFSTSLYDGPPSGGR